MDCNFCADKMCVSVAIIERRTSEYDPAICLYVSVVHLGTNNRVVLCIFL